MNHHHLDDFFGLKEQDEPTIVRKDGFKDKLRRRFGEDSQFRLLPKVLSKRERYAIFVLLLVIIGSVVAIPFSTIVHFTKPVADYGGTLVEGEIGQPRHINPLLAQTNDTDRDLTTLIYSGLLKYNEDGKLVPDLADHYEVSSDGLNYTVYLRPGAKWHDGQVVTAGDVVFTIQTAQNPDYGSPQRINWQGVTVTKVNDTTVIFTLKNQYAQFLNNLTLGILPQHIWQNVKAINFSLSDYNMKPIGSGPYVFQKYTKDDLGQIQSYDLNANPDWYGGRPYIGTVELRFYNSEDEMIAAYNRNEVMDLSTVSAGNLDQIRFKQRLNIEQVKLPRYFGVFFNQTRSNVLADKNIRLALNYATDKQALVDTVLKGNGATIYSPLIENVLDVGQDITKYQYNLDQAKQVLSADGWGNPDSNGILQKGTGKNQTRLTVHLTTSTFPELAQVADILKSQWAKVGVDVTVDALPTPQLQQAIKDRDYEALLFGEILNLDPDPFSLWDSSQIHDPGLNLALYNNKATDSLLESARQSLNPLDRISKYDDFQKLVIADVPAVFLYNSYYLYPVSTDVKGFDTTVISTPADRFDNIALWYINTKRIWRNSAQ